MAYWSTGRCSVGTALAPRTCTERATGEAAAGNEAADASEPKNGRAATALPARANREAISQSFRGQDGSWKDLSG